MTTEHRRGLERDTMVSWDVIVTLAGNQMISSEIFDCTSKGAFLKAEQRILDSVSIGDTLILKGENKGLPFNIEATVRWKGHSDTHDCTGIGVEFPGKHLVFELITRVPNVVPWDEVPQ